MINEYEFSFHNRLGRHTDDIMFDLYDHFSVSAVTGQEINRLFRINKPDLDFNSTGLFFEIKDKIGYPLDLTLENAVPKGIKCDSGRHSLPDERSINLINGRRDIETAGVDQVNGRQCLHTDRRRGDEFAKFTV